MRLLLTADTIGGVWTFACELAGALVARDVQILLVSFGGSPSTSQQANVERLIASGRCEYIASAIPLEWMPENAEAYSAGAELLLRLHQQFEPDALLLSQFCYGALPVSTPKIVIAHSDVLSWADAVGKAPLLEDTWLRTYRKLVQTGLDGAHMVITPTAAMLACLQHGFHVGSATKVIPNGRTLPRQTTCTSRQLRAVTAGRMWDPAKNLSLLHATESPLPILVAGGKMSGRNESSSIILLGHVDSDILLGLFRESAIYICTSRYEPFGLAPLEAALCGCAILANDIASLREVWGDGALYFHDAATLCALLRRLVNDPSLVGTAQTRSAARAAHYTAATMLEGYLDLLNACIEKPCSEAVLAA